MQIHFAQRSSLQKRARCLLLFVDAEPPKKMVGICLMYQETAHFYDFFNHDTTDTRTRARLIAGALKTSSAVLLDIGAGNGDIAFELAGAGHTLHCLEPSLSMHGILLERLSKRADLHSRVSAYSRRIEELVAPLNADLAYASSVFSHLNYGERLSLMRSLRGQLKPGGIFIFNLVRQVAGRPDKPLTLIGEKRVGEVTYRHFDAAEQVGADRRRVTWKFEVESRATGLKAYEESFVLNLDTEETVRTLLAEAGFTHVAEYGDWGGGVVDASAAGWVLVALVQI